MPEIHIDQNEIRKLLAAKNGDGALLWLCRRAGLSDLLTGFSAPQLQNAERLLRELGLDESAYPRFQQTQERPDYSEEDVLRRQERPEFRRLIREVQRCLGRVLNTEELKILLAMSDYLGLPHEVISMLVHYCIERSRDKGAGRLPSLRSIEKEAYRWADEGIDTMERAAAYIQSQTRRRSREAQLCAMLGIEGRKLTPTEERFLQAWAQMELTDEAVLLAFDKTCANTGGFKWAYMNSILKSWEAQGLRTVEQINTLDRKSTRPAPKQSGFQHHGQELSPMMKQAIAKLMEQEEEEA